MAILQSMIHGRGTSNELSSGAGLTLQKLTRARRELVGERTTTQNLIRMRLDHIFREFQGKAYGKTESVSMFNHLVIYLERHLSISCGTIRIQLIF
jgi:transposase